ncbi:MAG: hypothetical protein R2849_00940 [Thermomicrobiales bacterium]
MEPRTDLATRRAPSTLGEPFNLPGHDARCAVLEGDDLDARSPSGGPNILTLEHLEEAAYLINRPLLPGEERLRKAPSSRVMIRRPVGISTIRPARMN